MKQALNRPTARKSRHHKQWQHLGLFALLFSAFNALMLPLAQGETLQGGIEEQVQLPYINLQAMVPQLDHDGLSFKENCIEFDPAKLYLQKQNGRFYIFGSLGEKPTWLLDFGDKGEAAEQALMTIKSYGFNKYCRCGKSNSMKYFLIDNQAPQGIPESLVKEMKVPEDSLPVYLGEVKAEKVQNSWKVVQGQNGDEWMLDFGSDENAAKQAVEVIKHYGFKKQVFIGRPGAPLQFFRQ
ncbi:MAG: hypothetical protein LCH63_16755 [Candidatus Melainabacteria bacterium]|nr:hypothetical protein [Candidatus Melainabacteria bacterium]